MSTNRMVILCAFLLLFASSNQVSAGHHGGPEIGELLGGGLLTLLFAGSGLSSGGGGQGRSALGGLLSRASHSGQPDGEARSARVVPPPHAMGIPMRPQAFHGVAHGHGLNAPGMLQAHGLMGGVPQVHGLMGGLPQVHGLMGGLPQVHGLMGGLPQVHGLMGGVPQVHGLMGGVPQVHGLMGVVPQVNGLGTHGSLNGGLNAGSLSNNPSFGVEGIGNNHAIPGYQGMGNQGLDNTYSVHGHGNMEGHFPMPNMNGLYLSSGADALTNSAISPSNLNVPMHNGAFMNHAV